MTYELVSLLKSLHRKFSMNVVSLFTFYMTTRVKESFVGDSRSLKYVACEVYDSSHIDETGIFEN